MPTNSNWRLWQPPAETIEAIANTLSAHWAAAKSLQPKGEFWAHPGTWLRRQATRLVDSTRLVEDTEASEAAGDSAAP